MCYSTKIHYLKFIISKRLFEKNYKKHDIICKEGSRRKKKLFDNLLPFEFVMANYKHREFTSCHNFQRGILIIEFYRKTMTINSVNFGNQVISDEIGSISPNRMVPRGPHFDSVCPFWLYLSYSSDFSIFQFIDCECLPERCSDITA